MALERRAGSVLKGEVLGEEGGTEEVSLEAIVEVEIGLEEGEMVWGWLKRGVLGKGRCWGVVVVVEGARRELRRRECIARMSWRARKTSLLSERDEVNSSYRSSLRSRRRSLSSSIAESLSVDAHGGKAKAIKNAVPFSMTHFVLRCILFFSSRDILSIEGVGCVVLSWAEKVPEPSRDEPHHDRVIPSYLFAIFC